LNQDVVWEQDIKSNLHSADLILPLLSADAINTDYFYEKKVADALSRHKQGEARVAPLILRPCVWKTTPLKDSQALPKDGKPVKSWADREAAWSVAVESLWRFVETREQKLEEEKKHRDDEARRQAEVEKARLDAIGRKQREAEEQRRQEEQQRRRAAAEAERLKKEKEKTAERKIKLEEQRCWEVAEAERCRRQEEAALLKRNEVDRQRKTTVLQKCRQQYATLCQGLRSPWAWGSGLVLAAFFVFKTWSCNGPDGSLTLPMTGEDSTHPHTKSAYGYIKAECDENFARKSSEGRDCGTSGQAVFFCPKIRL
jgi:hypothetical protein